MPKVLNKRKNTPEHLKPHNNAVLVDRTTPWGNPYSKGTRQECIDKFRKYAYKRIVDDPMWLEPLRGKDLICWCAPKDCHANVILEILEDTKNENN